MLPAPNLRNRALPVRALACSKSVFCSADSALRRIASRSISYDFIYVGAGCSPADADFFAQFLSSEDGAMIAPVAPGPNLRSHLCHYTRTKQENFLAVMFAGWKR